MMVYSNIRTNAYVKCAKIDKIRIFWSNESSDIKLVYVTCFCCMKSVWLKTTFKPNLLVWVFRFSGHPLKICFFRPTTILLLIFFKSKILINSNIRMHFVQCIINSVLAIILTEKRTKLMTWKILHHLFSGQDSAPCASLF